MTSPFTVADPAQWTSPCAMPQPCPIRLYSTFMLAHILFKCMLFETIYLGWLLITRWENARDNFLRDQNTIMRDMYG